MTQAILHGCDGSRDGWRLSLSCPAKPGAVIAAASQCRDASQDVRTACGCALGSFHYKHHCAFAQKQAVAAAIVWVHGGLSRCWVSCGERAKLGMAVQCSGA